MRALSDRIEQERPGLPLFLLGHSWGSYLAQDYAQRWGGRLAGLVLSGSSGSQPPLVALVAPLLARLTILLQGASAPSELTYALSFKTYNKPFLPSASGSDNDWLSSDLAEVRKATADPLCAGFRLTNRSSLEFALAFNRIWRPENEARLPPSLPVLFMAGTEDPVSLRLASLRPLVERYRALGLADVETKFYEGDRHEVLNEVNREAVRSDLLSWLEERLPPGRDERH
jgi:alpha-beta hydrolase superfamily lysophospholipase